MVRPRRQRGIKNPSDLFATREYKLVNESMGLSTERKVIIGLFLVAGGALVVDQAILGPKEAGASELDLGFNLTPESILNVDLPTKGEIFDKTAASLLNERLSKFEQTMQADPSLDQMFGVPILDDEEVSNALTTGNTTDALSEQSGLPRLSAVMPSSTGGAAVINGVLVRVGDLNADGYRLISVQQRSAVIEKSGKKYTIALPMSGE